MKHHHLGNLLVMAGRAGITQMMQWQTDTALYLYCMPAAFLCPSVSFVQRYAEFLLPLHRPLTLCSDSSQTKRTNTITQMSILLDWDTIASKVHCSITPLNSTYNYVGLCTGSVSTLEQRGLPVNPWTASDKIIKLPACLPPFKENIFCNRTTN